MDRSLDELNVPLNELYHQEEDSMPMLVEQIDNLDDFFQSMYRFYGITVLLDCMRSILYEEFS